jgi:transaldolase
VGGRGAQAVSQLATRRAVFLDRDGVLTRATVRDGRPYPPDSLEALEPIPGAAEACLALRRAGFVLIVVTNQPDVARGKASRAVVEAMHERLRQWFVLDGIRVCYHDDGDGCACRKPKSGMLVEAAAEHGIDLAASWMVGDRWRDVGAGKAAGCRTILVDYGYDERLRDEPDLRVASLAEAARAVLEHEKAGEGGGMGTKRVQDLRVRLFADGADIRDMLELARNPLIKGFTTNPTLMRKAGVSDYRAFAREVLAKITDRPVSFEVFADEFGEMKRQALEIASWGPNVYVKIPITTTRGEGSEGLIADLSGHGVKLNVTAMTTLEQLASVIPCVAAGPGAFLSLFAGRIADTGVDPLPAVRAAVALLAPYPRLELIWASPRELLNIFQADEAGCHIITATSDVLKKLPLVGKELAAVSLDTVRMFYEDGQKAGYRL